MNCLEEPGAFGINIAMISDRKGIMLKFIPYTCENIIYQREHL